MSRSVFTPEELAELEAFDREIEEEDAPLTLEEWRESMRRDRGQEAPQKQRGPEEREKDRIKSREHRARKPEYYREAHRAWYAKNREYAQAWQREYCRTHKGQRRESERCLQERNLSSDAPLRLRELRRALGMTQAQLGEIFDRSRQVANNWESGKSTIPAAVLAWMEAQRDQA